MHKFQPWMTFPCNSERRVRPLKMGLIVFVSRVILVSLPKAKGKDRVNVGERGFGSVGFCSFFSGWLQVPMGCPQCALCGADPPPEDGMGSGMVLRGGCSEMLGFGVGTTLSLAKVPEGRIYVVWLPGKAEHHPP